MNNGGRHMALSKEDLEQIDSHVKSQLEDWLHAMTQSMPKYVYEMEMRERIVRVEEELKNQRELMKQGFDYMEKRFEQIDKRFEDVNSKFKMMFAFMSLGFTILAVMMTFFRFMQ